MTAEPLIVGRAIIQEGNSILMLQRSETDTHNPGLWEFPGGKIDANEELVDGLIREVKEETGLTISSPSSLAHVGSELISEGKYAGRLYVALFYVAQIADGDLIISDEHIDARWESPQYANTFAFTLESRLALQAFNNIGII